MMQYSNEIPVEGRISLTITEIDQEAQPLFLVLGRKGLIEMELRDPYTNEVVYRICDTGRSSISKKPDYELYRPQAGNLLVGSVRFGRTSTQRTMPLINKKAEGWEKVSLTETRNAGSLKWKTIKSQRKPVKDRWYDTANDGKAELVTNEEVIVLELVDVIKEYSAPIATVRLYNTQPNGRFEIWAEDAWTHRGGSWNALDEIVVSAYAAMEKAKRELMSGIDPASWRGVAT